MIICSRCPAPTRSLSEKRASPPPSGARVVEATYTQALSSRMPPSALPARWPSSSDGKTHGLDAYAGRIPAARSTSPSRCRCEPAAIRCIYAEGSGCYGHNGTDDVALDAALLARAVPGRPVRVQWMRDDEFAWEPYGSAMVMKAQAAVADGRILDWQYELWSSPHGVRPGAPDGSNLLASWSLAQPQKRPPARNIPLNRRAAAIATPSPSTICPTTGSSITSFRICRSGCRRCARSAPTPTYSLSNPSWTSWHPPPASIRSPSASRISPTRARGRSSKRWRRKPAGKRARRATARAAAA